MSDPGLPTNPEASPETAPELPVSSAEAEPPGYLWRPMEIPHPPLEVVARAPAPPRLIPNIGHALVFFALLIPSFIGAFLIAFFTLVAVLHPRNMGAVGGLMMKNIVYATGMQAIWYGLLWGLAALIFSLWWHRRFLDGVHWNAALARRWFPRLVLVGLLTGLAITLVGNFVPMPKAPPILEDLTKSASGAWMLMAFGVTIAPLTEELAFRGFLLPGFVNVFRWMERRQMIGEPAVRAIGIPISIVLTSIPFALMHSAQVSNSWGPVLLIGTVSVILCIVRLVTESVACGVVVHACYNFTLFVGLLYQTDWFRHLDKLKT
jgi:membrane protease YdiL (CAAX protease family)